MTLEALTEGWSLLVLGRVLVISLVTPCFSLTQLEVSLDNLTLEPLVLVG
jgi:hypothetical protein